MPAPHTFVLASLLYTQRYLALLTVRDHLKADPPKPLAYCSLPGRDENRQGDCISFDGFYDAKARNLFAGNGRLRSVASVRATLRFSYDSQQLLAIGASIAMAGGNVGRRTVQSKSK